MDWALSYAAIALPLILIPGFCIWRVHFDIMHTLDLGIYPTVLASVMWEITQRPGVFQGPSRPRFKFGQVLPSQTCRGARDPIIDLPHESETRGYLNLAPTGR